MMLIKAVIGCIIQRRTLKTISLDKQFNLNLLLDGFAIDKSSLLNQLLMRHYLDLQNITNSNIIINYHIN